MMLRVTLPQVWRLVSPTAPNRAQISGTSSILTQWNWKFWRSVTSQTSRPKRWVMRPTASTSSAVSNPLGTRTRIMKYLSSSGRCVYRPYQR